MSDIVIYENGEVALKATVENETIWLSQKQIAELFSVQRPAITKHLNNIFKCNELEEEVVCSKMEHTTQHGAIEGKTQIKNLKYYNLDAILSIGYRVNSKSATQFRIWANKILKEYLIKGYALNKERLQQQKFDELNATITLIRSNIANNDITLSESKGFVEIVSNYARSWALLQGYDEAKKSIELFKETFMHKKEATTFYI